MEIVILLVLVSIVSFVFGALWSFHKTRRIAEHGLRDYMYFIQFKLGADVLTKLNSEYMRSSIKLVKEDN